MPRGVGVSLTNTEFKKRSRRLGAIVSGLCFSEV